VLSFKLYLASTFSYYILKKLYIMASASVQTYWQGAAKGRSQMKATVVTVVGGDKGDKDSVICTEKKSPRMHFLSCYYLLYPLLQ